MKYFVIAIFLTALTSSSAYAENLYKPGQAPALASDLKATNLGDILTVVIVQNAEARNSARNVTEKSTGAGGAFSGSGGTNGFFDFSLGRDYSGVGEVRRSESFVTQMSATVSEVYQNGDFLITGTQFLVINGETTQIDIEGRIRRFDISANNTILSSRIADARIRYDGEGFVTDSAKPGLITRIFSTLGLI